jgi:hypothetical protein
MRVKIHDFIQNWIPPAVVSFICLLIEVLRGDGMGGLYQRWA